MSELNTNPEELIENITFEIDEAPVVATPIDPTLTIPGEAADAKATGDAIAAIIGRLLINGKAASGYTITLYAPDIKMSAIEGAQTIAEAIEGISAMDASTIMYNAAQLITVKAAIDGINTTLDTELTEAEIDAIFNEVFGGEE